MTFFYSSPAGAVDLVALVGVCAAGLALGGSRSRLLALAMLAVYLADRALLWTVPLPVQMALGSLVELAALTAVLILAPDRVGRAMAMLFAIKMVLYVAVLLDLMSWGAMTAGATLACYAQLVLVMMGVRFGGLKRWFGNRVRNRPSVSGGSHPLAVGVPSRRSDLKSERRGPARPGSA